jgi:hypothetical protein
MPSRFSKSCAVMRDAVLLHTCHVPHVQTTHVTRTQPRWKVRSFCHPNCIIGNLIITRAVNNCITTSNLQAGNRIATQAGNRIATQAGNRIPTIQYIYVEANISSPIVGSRLSSRLLRKGIRCAYQKSGENQKFLHSQNVHGFFCLHVCR